MHASPKIGALTAGLKELREESYFEKCYKLVPELKPWFHVEIKLF